MVQFNVINDDDDYDGEHKCITHHIVMYNRIIFVWYLRYDNCYDIGH